MTIPNAPRPMYAATQPQNGATSPEDLTRPLYGAKFGSAVKRFFKQYANFQGRASRSEYWWAALFTFLITLVPTILCFVGLILSAIWADQNPNVVSLGSGSDGNEVIYESAPGVINAPTAAIMFIGFILLVLVTLAILVPSLAIAWRRLHDANLPGPMWFLTFVPSIGSIIILVFMVLPSKPEGQRFDKPLVAQAPTPQQGI